MRRSLAISFLAAAALLLGLTHAEALCVSADTANLRSGPGTNHEKVWEVYRYMPFKQVASKGPWRRVRDVDGDTYWVHSKLVTSRYKCAVVKSDEANVRTGPGTKYRKARINPAYKYYSYKVLEVRGKWVKVINQYKDVGWIYKQLLWIQ